MQIAHISDTHHRPDIVESVGELGDIDIIVLTGDLVDNYGRRDHRGIRRRKEQEYQRDWLDKHTPLWAEAFEDTPVIMVNGNHDFVSPAGRLRRHGCNVTLLNAGDFIDVQGKRFAGFSEVPYIIGEWEGEEHDLKPFVEKAMATRPDILLVHAPAATILDQGGYGNRPLLGALAYTDHKVTHVFCGHAHSRGGQVAEEMGITFINGAGRCATHVV